MCDSTLFAGKWAKGQVSDNNINQKCDPELNPCRPRRFEGGLPLRPAGIGSSDP